VRHGTFQKRHPTRGALQRANRSEGRLPNQEGGRLNQWRMTPRPPHLRRLSGQKLSRQSWPRARMPYKIQKSKPWSARPPGWRAKRARIKSSNRQKAPGTEDQPKLSEPSERPSFGTGAREYTRPSHIPFPGSRQSRQLRGGGVGGGGGGGGRGDAGCRAPRREA